MSLRYESPMRHRSLLVGLALPLLAGCGQTPAVAPQPPAATTAAPAEPVTVGKPERHSLRRTVEQPGHIEAFAETPLLAKIPGFVKAVNVDIGDRVAAGDVLAELSVPELDREL